jgi:hydrogenase maturation protease
MSSSAPRPTVQVVVAGLGSEYRGDDGVGLAIAAKVAELAGDVVDVGPIADPLDLLGRWDGVELAVVADAVRSGAEPGTIWVIDLDDDAETPAGGARTGATSSHGIGLAGALRLSRAVGQAPARVVAVGIEGADFTQGSGLSPAVARAVDVAARRAVDRIDEIR